MKQTEKRLSRENISGMFQSQYLFNFSSVVLFPQVRALQSSLSPFCFQSAPFVFNKISSSHLIHKRSAPECCLSQPHMFTFLCLCVHIFLSSCTSSKCLEKKRLLCASSFTFLIYKL